MNFHPKSPLLTLKLDDILKTIESAPQDTFYAYGNQAGKEHLKAAVRALKIDKQGRVDATSAINALKDLETAKMPGGANAGIHWIVRSLSFQRIKIGPVFKIGAYNSLGCALSYEDKRIHLRADFTFKCNTCGKVHERPGTDFICYAEPGKVIWYDCGNCDTETPMFELEGLGDDYAVLRYAGGLRWSPKAEGQIEPLKYKGHFKLPESPMEKSEQ